MKRLTKSQYELVAETLKYYVDDTRQSIEYEVANGSYNNRVNNDRLSLLKSIALDYQQKFMLTDTEFKPKQFLEGCGFTNSSEVKTN